MINFVDGDVGTHIGSRVNVATIMRWLRRVGFGLSMLCGSVSVSVYTVFEFRKVEFREASGSDKGRSDTMV